MVRCAAYGCKSGYDSTRACKSDTPVTFHSFPLRNSDLVNKWIKANPRQDFTPTKSSRLCSLHFRDSDFVDERTDSNKSRKQKKAVASDCNRPLRRYLKPNVVPSIFRNAPSYLSKPNVERRTTTHASTSSRLECHQRQLEEMEVSFYASEDVTNLSVSELAEKLRADTTLPTSYTITVADEKLLIILLDLTSGIPKIAASLTLDSSFTVIAAVQDNVIPASQYVDLLQEKTVRQLSQLSNLMARLKSWVSQPSSRSLEFNIQMAARLLQEGVESCEDSDSEQCKKLLFLIEQLRMVQTSKFARHYSPQLILTSYLLYANSAAGYKALCEQNVLSIPSLSTLKKVTKRLDTTSGLDNSTYLKLRLSKLNAFERSDL